MTVGCWLVVVPAGAKERSDALWQGAGEHAGAGAASVASNRSEFDATTPASVGEALPTIPVQPVGQLDAEPTMGKPRGRVLEEIVVVAQKREQAIQDVPISMSALEADFLIDQGVTDIRDAMLLVPNVQIESAGFFSAPRVRGFSFNNNNKAFEPPVGMVIDGIPYTLVPYFSSALFDTQRIEVLRGPQGTTFGKNTTAGVIHLISNTPTADPGGYLSVQYGELQRRRIEAAYGAPLTDGVNFRLSALYDARDGYIRNTTAAVLPTAAREVRDRDRSGLRAQLQWEDLAGSTLLLALEHVQLYDGGAGAELIVTGPNFRNAVRRYDPNADFVPGNYIISEDFPGYRDVQIDTVRAQWEMPLDQWTLTAVSGYSMLEEIVALDVDFTPAPGLSALNGDRSPTLFGEVRVVSPELPGLMGLEGFGDHSTLLAGLVYDRRAILDSFFDFYVGTTAFLDLQVAATQDQRGLPAPPALPNLPFNPLTTDLLDEFVSQNFEQRARAYSAYLNLQWALTERWGVELGVRYTYERKDAQWNQFFGAPVSPAATALGFQPFMADLDYTEGKLQPKIALSYKLSPGTSVFAHWARGFKGGGFNAFAYRNAPADNNADLVYDAEESDDYGLDLKSTLFDGAARFNLSLFRQTARDFQVLVRNNPPGTIGSGTTAVTNAPKARSQGVEADLTWLTTEWLTLIGALGLNDTEYLDFPDNECPIGRANEDGDDNPRCDATGKSFPFAPRVSVSQTINLSIPGAVVLGRLAGVVLLHAGTTIEFQSSQLLDLDLDERKRQGAFTRFKASVGASHPHAGWSLRLIGENLSDEVTRIRMGDVFPDVIVGGQNEPRLFYLQFRQDF